MSEPKPDLQLSEADIRAIYAEGEEAVVSLVTQLLNRLNQLEAEVKELKGRLSKNSRNSSKLLSGDGFGKHTRSLRRKSDQSSGGQAGHPGQTLEWPSEGERDLRMMKLKQKISVCFRSEDGVRQFCRIRGYLANLRKQGLNILDALLDLFVGNPQALFPQPESYKLFKDVNSEACDRLKPFGDFLLLEESL